MKPKEKDSIRKQIQEEIHTTEKSVLRYQDLAKPIAPENAIGRISRMDAINNRSISEEALRKAKLKLNNLQIALSNIDDDDFGICGKCHQQIPVGRILLVPQSRFCVNCAR